MVPALSIYQAFATGALTGILNSPSNNITGKSAQYLEKFTTSTTGVIASVDLIFPAGTLDAQANTVVKISGLGAGTLTSTGSGGPSPTVTYTVTSPVSVPSGTTVIMFIGKLVNSNTGGPTFVTINTKDGSNNIIDTGVGNMNLNPNAGPQGSAGPQGPQGSAGPQGPQGSAGPAFSGSSFNLNLGNTEFGSHPCHVTITPASYLAHNGIKISMMNYLNDKPTYGQLAYADGDPFLGEVELFPYNFAPRGFMHADGSILPIAQNQALFALIGTIFGGDGQFNFAIPDLRCMEPPNMQYDISLVGIFPSRN